MPIYRAGHEWHYFAHIPKAGGTSVERMLEARFGALLFFDGDPDRGSRRGTWTKCAPQHVQWDEFVRLVPAEAIAASFSVVRHPVARIVSAINMRLAVPHPPVPRGISALEFLDWVTALRARSPYVFDNHFRPQVEFVPEAATVFRLEDGLDAVARYLDAQRAVPPDGGGSGGAWHNRREVAEDAFEKREVPRELVSRIRRIYAADYERFGYDDAPSRPSHLLMPRGKDALKAGVWRARQAAARLRR